MSALMDIMSKKYNEKDDLDEGELEALTGDCLKVTPADIRFRELGNAIQEQFDIVDSKFILDNILSRLINNDLISKISVTYSATGEYYDTISLIKNVGDHLGTTNIISDENLSNIERSNFNPPLTITLSGKFNGWKYIQYKINDEIVRVHLNANSVEHCKFDTRYTDRGTEYIINDWLLKNI